MINVVENNGIFYIKIADSPNIIYNKITDPVSLRSCYPDIFYVHEYEEAPLNDSEIYEIAYNILKKNGSASLIVYSGTMPMINSEYNTYVFPYETYIEQLSDDLRLSQTMRKYLKDYFIYYDIKGMDTISYIETLKNNYSIPVATKNEGKIIYDIIKKHILS